MRVALPTWDQKLSVPRALLSKPPICASARQHMPEPPHWRERMHTARPERCGGPTEGGECAGGGPTSSILATVRRHWVRVALPTWDQKLTVPRALLSKPPICASARQHMPEPPHWRERMHTARPERCGGPTEGGECHSALAGRPTSLIRFMVRRQSASEHDCMCAQKLGKHSELGHLAIASRRRSSVRWRSASVMRAIALLKARLKNMRVQGAGMSAGGAQIGENRRGWVNKAAKVSGHISGHVSGHVSGHENLKVINGQSRHFDSR